MKRNISIGVVVLVIVFGALFAQSNSINNSIEELSRKQDRLSNAISLKDISSEDVYTFECELASHKPKMVSTSCATLGTHVRNIKWTKWEATGAKGTGIFSTQTCDPSCAEGGRIDLKVKVKLDGLIQLEDKFFLTFFEIQYREKMTELFSPYILNDLIWRLDDFYIQMNGRTLPDYDF